MKKKWKIILGALVLMAAGGFVLSQLLQDPEVDVTRVELTGIKRSFTEEGLVVPRYERTIYALQTARIKELPVREGDRVERGDLLAVLDDTELRFSIEALKAQLSSLEGEKLLLEEEPGPAQQESYKLRVEEAENNLEAAKRNLERLERLYREGYLIGVKEAEENLVSAQRHYNRVKQLYEEAIAPRAEYEEARDMVTKAENYLSQQEHALKVFTEAEYEKAEELVKQAEYTLAQQEKALLVLHESYRPPEGSREIIEAQKKAIQAQVDLAKYQQNHYRLTAPISGRVVDIHAREGDIVSPQVPIMRLFQEDDYRVEVMVLTRDIYDIAPGMPVKLILELRDRERVFPGEVLEISPYAEKGYSPLGLEEERVKVTVAPEIPGDIRVASGYRLDVEFTTEEHDGQIVVPKTALFTHQGEDALLVVENDHLTLRIVETGLETRQEVVIREGLKEGELVVLDPQLITVDEGARVSYSIAGEEK